VKHDLTRERMRIGHVSEDDGTRAPWFEHSAERHSRLKDNGDEVKLKYEVRSEAESEVQKSEVRSQKADAQCCSRAISAERKNRCLGYSILAPALGPPPRRPIAIRIVSRRLDYADPAGDDFRPSCPTARRRALPRAELRASVSAGPGRSATRRSSRMYQWRVRRSAHPQRSLHSISAGWRC
jgi:hypothetical protein